MISNSDGIPYTPPSYSPDTSPPQGNNEAQTEAIIFHIPYLCSFIKKISFNLSVSYPGLKVYSLK